MKHKTKIFMASLLVLLGLGFAFQFSSSAPLTQSMPWYTVDNGGGRSSGGALEVVGTAGQPDAGTMGGGVFEVSGGFWYRARTLGLVPDVTIAKSANAAQAEPGDVITYTISFSNDGTAVATGITLTDLIPAGLINTSYISSGAIITPVVGADYQWQVADLAPDAGGTITITATIDPGLTVSVAVVNTAAISADADGNTANNSDSATVQVTVTPETGFYTLYLPVILRAGSGNP